MSDAFFHDKDAFDAIASLNLVNETDHNMNGEDLVFQVYSTILNRYFQFNKYAVQKVEQMLSRFRNRYLVGFHIRMGDAESDFKEGVHFLYKSDIARFVNCCYIDRSQDPVFYVASDSSAAKAIIKMHAKNTVFQNATAVHSRGEIRRRHGTSGLQGVLVDILFLSKCHVIVGTKGSSFTYLAAAFQGHYPYYVTRNTDCYCPQHLTTLLSSLKEADGPARCSNPCYNATISRIT